MPKLLFALLLALTHSVWSEEQGAGSIPIAELQREKPVDFEKEILPVFKKNCLACHNAKDAKGELVLETPVVILKGGETGPGVIPHKASESLLLKVAARQEKPFMPPKNNKAGAVPLTSEELGLIKLWIEQGATGIVSTALGPVHWQSLPASLKGVTSVSVTKDGQFAACGRANQIFIYHLPTKQLISRLTDPALLESGFAKGPGIADRDIIQSVAFSPDGNLLASGAYRSLKLWERKPVAPDLNLPYVAAGAAASVAASSDGSVIATGGEDGTVKTWSAKEGRLLREFRGHTAVVNSVSFSPDDTRLASGSADQTVRVWNLNQAGQAWKASSTGTVEAVTWIAKDQIATGGGDNSVRIWKIEAEQSTNAPTPLLLPGHGQPVMALVIVPGKTELLSGSKDGVIKHWNLTNNQLIREMNHGGEITSLSVRPDGKRFASAGMNNIVKLWDIEGKMIAELKGDRQAREFATEMERALTFAKCEVEFQKGAVDSADKTEKAETEALKKATEAKEKAEKSFAEKDDGFKKAVEGKTVAEKALEDLKLSIAGAKEKKAVLEKSKNETEAAAKPFAEKVSQAKAALDNATGQKAAAYQGILDLAFQAKIAMLTALESKGNLEKETNNAALLEKKNAAEKASAEKLLAAQTAADQYAAAKITFDSATAAKADADNVYAEAEQKVKAAADAFAANEKLITEPDKLTKDAEEKIKNAVKQFADAEAAFKLAEGVKNGAIQGFESTQLALKKAGENLAKSKQELKLAEEAQTQASQVFETARKSATETEKPVHSLVFTSDNQLILWGGDDGIVRSASAENGQVGERFVAHTGRVLGLASLPGGQFISASGDQSVKLWSSISQWELKRVIGDGSENSPLIDRVLALDFTDDGKLLASGGGFPSRSGEIKIWTVADGSLLKEFRDPHSDTVVALDFSPDQNFLASGGSDKFVRVFELESGKQVKAFEGHTHHVQGVSWKRDQRTLASAGADRVIKIWDFASGEQRKTIEGFGKEMTSVQFLFPTKVDRNFEALVSSGDTQVKFVKEDGNHIRAFGGSAEFVTSATATPDGTVVVAGALDGILRVWKGENAESLMTFEPPKEEGQLATK